MRLRAWLAVLCLGTLPDMGGNAVRLAHYQHDQRSYEIADERAL